MFNSASALRSAIGSTLVFEKDITEKNINYATIGSVKNDYYNIKITVNSESNISFEVIDGTIINILSSGKSRITLWYKKINDTNGKTKDIYLAIQYPNNDTIRNIKVEVNYLNSEYTSDITSLSTIPNGYGRYMSFYSINAILDGEDKEFCVSKIVCKTLQLGKWSFGIGESGSQILINYNTPNSNG